MKNTKVIKILLSIVIMVMFIGCGNTTNINIKNTDNEIKFDNFGITELSYKDDSNWDAEVQNIFGSEYLLSPSLVTKAELSYFVKPRLSKRFNKSPPLL